jgi:hypothetical protein
VKNIKVYHEWIKSCWVDSTSNGDIIYMEYVYFGRQAYKHGTIATRKFNSALSPIDGKIKEID